MSAEAQAISYLRVSTYRQGASGLGLEAQREAVTAFAAARGIRVLEEYVEIESGRNDDRPALAQALARAKRAGATLLIAKLDRLGRSVAFVSSLMDAGVDFKAVDLPEANRFVLHVMAAVAEYEREQISERTKAALAAAKARGVKLGTYSHVLKAQSIAGATAFAQTLEGYVSEVIDGGAITVREIATALNARGVPSRSGSSWGTSNTARLLQRLGRHPTPQVSRN